MDGIGDAVTAEAVTAPALSLLTAASTIGLLSVTEERGRCEQGRPREGGPTRVATRPGSVARHRRDVCLGLVRSVRSYRGRHS